MTRAARLGRSFAIADLRHAFAIRMSEWSNAMIIALWGVVMLMPIELYERTVFTAFRALASQEALGLSLVIFGVGRLMVLSVNGIWRPMYYLRSASALMSAVFWLVVTLGFLQSGRIGTWIAVYPILFVFDAINAFRAASDAGRNDRLHEEIAGRANARSD